MTTRSLIRKAGEPDTRLLLDWKLLKKSGSGSNTLRDTEVNKNSLQDKGAAMRNFKDKADAVIDLRCNPHDKHSLSSIIKTP